MDRREAVRNMAFLMGGAISLTTMGALFESCTHTPASGGAVTNIISSQQQGIITQIADIIIPTTDTPGAKAAGVGPFVAMMITECYPEGAQKVFLRGLDDVEDRSKTIFNKIFMELTANQQNHVIKAIAERTAQLKADDKKHQEADKAANQIVTNSKGGKQKGKPYFFQLIRELTLLGYFTSEIGATKALAYVPVPGRFDGCVDFKPGQKAWAF